jgi:cell division protein FtsQ
MSVSSDVFTRTRIDPRIRARRIDVARTAGRRRLQRLVELGSVALVAVAFVGALRSPLLDVETIRVAGGEHTSAEEVLAAAGIELGDQLIDVDLAAAGARVAALPWVEQAHLGRRLDGTISIRLVERVPVATVRAASGPLLVDVSGRVLGPVDELAEPAPALVRVGGVPRAVEPGSTVPRRFLPALDLARRLATVVPGEVAVVRPGDDLTAVLAAGGRVRFGDRSRFEAKLVALTTVLDRVDLRCLSVLDLRLPANPVLTREDGCS